MRARQGKKKVEKRRSIKTKYLEYEFDSETEANYYKYLLKDKTILNIELQPAYEIIAPYKVVCKRCKGFGKQLNKETSNYNKCRLCSGKGVRTKAGARYTADFKLTYIDGFTEIIDVKGGPVTRDFPLRKKLLEGKLGEEVIVVRFIKKEWVRE